MSYTIEKLEKSRVKFTFDVDAETFGKAVVAAYNKTKHKYSVPGFRKGHVPMKVIEGMYGREVFFEDAMDIVIPEVYSEALDKEHDIEVVSQPELESFDFKEDGGVTFVLTTAVRPEVKLDIDTADDFCRLALLPVEMESDARAILAAYDGSSKDKE